MIILQRGHTEEKEEEIFQDFFLPPPSFFLLEAIRGKKEGEEKGGRGGETTRFLDENKGLSSLSSSPRLKDPIFLPLISTLETRKGEGGKDEDDQSIFFLLSPPSLPPQYPLRTQVKNKKKN